MGALIAACALNRAKTVNDFDKRDMKRGRVFNKHICDFFSQISPVRQQKLSIFTFRFISLLPSQPEFLSDKNEKNIMYVEANVPSMYAKFQLYLPYGF